MRHALARLAAGLGLLTLIVPVWPVLAQSSYTVSDIPVDVTAADAVAARDQAIEAGQRDGLRQLFAQLTGDGGAPDVSGLDLGRLVRSYEIASEQVGARRYIGRLNVTYNGQAVRDALGRAGLAVVPPPPPTLIVPASLEGSSLALWLGADAWRSAIGEAVAGRPALLVPLGDGTDLATLTPAAVAAGDRAAFQQLADRYGATNLVVAILEPGGEVELRDGLGGLLGPDAVRVETVPAAGEEAAARATVDRIAAALKEPARAVPTGPVEAMNVAVPIADLSTWVQIKRELEGLAEVKSVAVGSFSTEKADIILTYVGDVASLQDALQRRGLDLALEGGEWRLHRVAGPRAGAF